ncbi:MAG: Peptidase M23 family protein [Candidatus Woesebacteria bacterium GW2011_GWA1_37_8]|uniref:Peptidase M23 family protein n=2 Tax=Candidatus Woeseibacteriota TaxID=1752722 RepID=A0A0G0NNG4_9BACT|nr:MAG: Peptidase M23 family protein [Candidatus Woesebacteria bacterium GW2011_GWA1_37_8]KKQ87449.1 MAG: Peptidase M23 family protein [Candidatus Woesebacteria bacterium GW2011_GWB1_38_8b]
MKFIFNSRRFKAAHTTNGGSLRKVDFGKSTKSFFKDVVEFCSELTTYIIKKLHLSFIKFEGFKKIFVVVLYRQRGKYAKRFIHSGMAGLAALGILIAPVVADEFPKNQVNPWDIASPSSIVTASTDDTTTLVSEKARDKIIEYEVQEGDNVASIAEKFGISTETVLWQNNLDAKSKIKIGQNLQILPVTGMSHKVSKGDTVYSIAKKYDTSPQAVVDFPFNAFVNDETFELAIGQIVIVPDGVKPKEAQSSPRIRQITPDAGTVVASGSFVWPTSGTITQNFYWYHKGIDIANRAAPDVLAADSGKVVSAGWLDGYGYGNRVIIDHGNGYRTLYAHLQKIYVIPGQTVARGSAVGKMGSTGRSTGTHLHFEVTRNGSSLNPLSVLR